MSAAMYYPANYGYVPQTLAGDGDPVDVLVVTPVPLPPGVVVTCRAIGILNMQDEAGNDAKVLAVPVSKKLPLYDGWKTPDDAPQSLTRTITHFFEHYKDLEAGKWVKVLGWDGPEAAKKENCRRHHRRQKVSPRKARRGRRLCFFTFAPCSRFALI